MDYSKFMRFLLHGNEFIGYIDDDIKITILNVIEDTVTICISGMDDDIHYHDDEVLDKPIYDNLTFKELFEDNRIRICEIY